MISGGRLAALAAAGLVVCGGLTAFVLLRPAERPPAPVAEPPAALTPAEKPAVERPAAEAAVAAIPKLYCQFYVFTEQRPRVAFLFEVGETPPRFRQLYVAEDNGQRTDFPEDERPDWRYEPAREPKRIASTIKVPDSSQFGFHDEDIAIELYDYRPDRDAKTFFEASLKNIYFQNLPGKCRQARG